MTRFIMALAAFNAGLGLHGNLTITVDGETAECQNPPLRLRLKIAWMMARMTWRNRCATIAWVKTSKKSNP